MAKMTETPGYYVISQAQALIKQNISDPQLSKQWKEALGNAEECYRRLRTRHAPWIKRFLRFVDDPLASLPATLWSYMSEHATRADLVGALTDDVLSRGEVLGLNENDQALRGLQQWVARLLALSLRMVPSQSITVTAASSRESRDDTQDGRGVETRKAAVVTVGAPPRDAKQPEPTSNASTVIDADALSRQLTATRRESLEWHERAKLLEERVRGLQTDIIQLLDTMEPQWSATHPQALQGTTGKAAVGDTPMSEQDFYALSLDTLRNHLLEMLEHRFGLRSIVIPSGSRFDPATMAIVGTESTDDSRLEKQVSREVKRGYLMRDGATYRPAEVYVFAPVSLETSGSF